MKKHILSLLFISITFSITAQQNQHEWHFNGGDTGYDEARTILSDAQGNNYICGRFSGTQDFDPGPGVYNLSVPAGANYSDAFVQKLDAQGNFLWAKRFGSNTPQTDYAISMALDQQNNVYVLGHYTGSITLNPGDTTWPSGSTILSSPFLVKLDSLGNYQWGMGWKNTTPSEAFWSAKICVDTLNRVYMGGVFSGTIDFDPTPNSVQLHTAATAPTSQSTFLLRISENGTVEKVRTIGTGTTGSGFFYDMYLDANQDIYFTGVFSGTIDFDNGPGTDVLITGAGRPYLSKVDSNFTHKWVKEYDGNSDNLYVTSNTNSLYVLCRFKHTVNLDVGGSLGNMATSKGSTDIAVIKLDTAGNFKWGKHFGGTGYDNIWGLALTPNENILVNGHFEGTADFDPGTASYNLTSNGLEDGFVMRLDSAGNFVSAAQLGGSGSDFVRQTHVMSEDRIFASGYFSNTMDIDPGLSTINITSNGDKDFFMVKLKSCSSVFTAFSDTVCGSYTVPSGDSTYLSSGIYNDTLLSAMGCDSVLTINVKVNATTNPTVTQTVDGLVASASDALTYQWYDCTTQQLISGANNPNYMPNANGQYAVITSNGICTDTSACFTVNNISVTEHNWANNIVLYPNPTAQDFRFKSDIEILELDIYDLTGRPVFHENNPENKIDISKLKAGTYLVSVRTQFGFKTFRLVKEE